MNSSFLINEHQLQRHGKFSSKVVTIFGDSLNEEFRLSSSQRISSCRQLPPDL